MAVAAKKAEYLYAPSRVYSQSRASTAEALPQAAPQQQEAAPQQPARTKEPAVKTRVHKGPSPRQLRKQRILPKVASIACIFIAAAVLIGVIVRYSAITLAHSAVNQLTDDIAESERNIAALNVQLNNALSIEAARETAQEAGLWYPTAEQIVHVQETIGNYQRNEGGPEEDSGRNQDAGTNPDEDTDTE